MLGLVHPSEIEINSVGGSVLPDGDMQPSLLSQTGKLTAFLSHRNRDTATVERSGIPAASVDDCPLCVSLIAL